MKTIKLSTELLNHLMCVGMYESWFNGDTEWEDCEEYFRMEHPDFEGEIPVVYDEEANEFAIIEALGMVLEDEVKPYLKNFGVKDIIIGGWYHPRYYNFETDSLDLDFEVDDDFYKKAAEIILSWKDDKMVHEYIADHFASRSGFISFCPESWQELYDNISGKNPTVQAVGNYLCILLVKKFGEEYLQEELEYHYFEDVLTNTQICYIDDSNLAA